MIQPSPAPTPQEGDILLVRGSGFPDPDWWIRWAEARHYGKARGPADPAWVNHATYILDEIDQLEAEAHGILRRPIATCLAENSGAILVRPAYEPGRAADATRAALRLEGQPYDFPLLASEALIFLTGTKLRFGLAGTSICSGFVGYVLTEGGLDVGTDEEWLSPADLAAICFQVGWPAWRVK